jgi:nitrous oxidase accessory protein
MRTDGRVLRTGGLAVVGLAGLALLSSPDPARTGVGGDATTSPAALTPATGSETLAAHPLREHVAGATIRVGAEGDVPTIAAALDRARDGDRISIGPGTYREGTLVVERSITLEGEGWPVLDGEDSHTILIVTAPDVTVRGLELRAAGMSHVRDHAAVLVEGARGCRIEDNRLEDNFFGIYLARARECVVSGNRISASGEREAVSGNGIHLWDARQVEVRGNRIAGHRDGIYLEFAEGTVIRDNVAEGNLRYGLHFMFSDGSLYEGNTFRRNGAGVAVMYSRDVDMRGNLFVDNWGPAAYGLLLKDVRDSRIEGNTFRQNTTAIFSDGSDRLVFRGNRVTRNGWAVKIMASSQENLFTGNDFVENTFDVTTNSRRNFNTFRGNHWSAYDGYDLDGDGIGDVSHRPVRLFSLVVQQSPVAMVLLRSFFVELLELAERILPVLTPETLVDDEPVMRELLP